jgi:hypothetical protein
VLDGRMSPKKNPVATPVAVAVCVTGGEEEGVVVACGATPMATCLKKERALLIDVDEYPGLR